MSDLPFDPGMEVKMAGGGFPGLAELASGRPCDEAELLHLCDYVDARHDCADFRALALVKVLHAFGDLVSAPTRERIEASLLGFPWFADEPGTDAMCTWSENHQAIFGVGEYLAGQAMPDRTFAVAPHGMSRLTGRQRQARAGVRLRQWCRDRLRHGYTEWLSPTYYEEDIAPLAVLVDHADDPELVQLATMALDLALLDLALHGFRGRLVASAGRCYEASKLDPSSSGVNELVRHAFGASPDDPEPERPFEPGNVGALFTHRTRYEVPEALQAIAATEGRVEVEESFGLDCDEIAEHFDVRDPWTAGLYAWAQQAFTTPATVQLSVDALRAWRMERNAFLRPLAPFTKVPRALLPSLVRALNPATQGVAIQRADVRTVRTPHWQVSAAQRHHPREFGDQQHIWQATLPGEVTVFATHPGRAMFDHTARNFSPAEWVGNGRHPDVVSTGNLLLAVHDLRGRRGLLEPPRADFTHLWFPSARFDQVRRGPNWVAGRVGASLIGVVGSHRLEPRGESELRQRGVLTAWGVVCSDTSVVDFDHFSESLSRQRPRLSDRSSTWNLDPVVAEGHRSLELHRDGPALLDGRHLRTRFERLDSPFGRIARHPRVLEVEAGGHRLRLDAEQLTREVS